MIQVYLSDDDGPLPQNPGDTLLLVMTYYAMSDGSPSVDFGSAPDPWVLHETSAHMGYNWDDPNTALAWHHVYVATLKLTDGPLGGARGIPLFEGAPPPSPTFPRGGYVVYSLGGVHSDAIAAFAHAFNPGPTNDPSDPSWEWDASLPAVTAVEGGFGLLVSVVDAQAYLGDPPAEVTEGKGASWFSGPYSQLIFESYYELDLPAGPYSRDFGDGAGTFDKILLVIRPEGG